MKSFLVFIKKNIYLKYHFSFFVKERSLINNINFIFNLLLFKN